ncbi:putative repeat protein (TIGR01451 family) [Pacificibacter maritimus]|uniref:Putative repeat protein (TIGR01451 family) n=1 Tax=Pacificibacter maritimus TaxID=762213 RepID=A0A3N4UTN6_9RHOB|nr:NEW3 domain-containing protein [Pacificibacter maritimus]RPE70911.1 putative repeat protein (TIGR01451 family) [Pacificibacter maritimus]
MSYHSKFMRTASVVAVSALVGAAAFAAPEAGVVIGNQAVATYQNAAGDTITVTSNTVETVVQQVAGVTLTSNNSETIAPGGKAFLPHVITNNGNGPDSFALSAVEDDTGALDTTRLVFYPDANMDGVADSSTPITETPVLGNGEQFGVVIEASVASTATGTDDITVTATSLLDGAETSVNTDTLTISTDAIVELVKNMTVDPGINGIVDSGDEVTITLTYSSTGLAAANDYSVQDILDADLVYQAGSAVWSDSSVALNDDNTATTTDATNGNGETIAWDYDDAQTVGFTISSVGSGRSGSVTFKATIASTAQAGIVQNTATQTVNGAAFPPSNTAQLTVDNQYNISVADTAIDAAGAADAASNASGTDDDTLNNDVVTESTDVYQGGVVKHEFVLTNNSNVSDSLSLSVDNLDFPAGTTFRFVGSDGVTPIVGPVGPLAIGESTKVTLIAQLPTDLAPTATTDYTATVTTTSEGSGISDTSTAEFDGAILASAVDLENAVVGSEGDGAAPTNGGNPWITTTTDPGAPVTFEMLVENNGPVSDTYGLALNTPLPAGWTVEFQLADGTVVSNTGTIAAGNSLPITVVVTPADLAPPADTLIDINVASAVSGQSDSIINQVTVNEIYDVEIIQDQTVQASPGGVVDILHTVTNAGNVTIIDGAITESGLSDFSGAIFYDIDNNGVLDATDPVIDNFNDIAGGLAAGDSLSLIYRVQTPSTATVGVSEIGTITLDSTLNTTETDADTADNASSDTIQIISGDVTLTKYQYIDAACDGTVGVFTKNRLDVEPGQCVRYLVEAENTGSSAADNVLINDAAPAYTTITNCGGSCDAVLVPGTSTSTITATGVSSSHGTVLPGSKASVEFTVQVEN